MKEFLTAIMFLWLISCAIVAIRLTRYPWRLLRNILSGDPINSPMIPVTKEFSLGEFDRETLSREFASQFGVALEPSESQSRPDYLLLQEKAARSEKPSFFRGRVYERKYTTTTLPLLYFSLEHKTDDHLLKLDARLMTSSKISWMVAILVWAIFGGIAVQSVAGSTVPFFETAMVAVVPSALLWVFAWITGARLARFFRSSETILRISNFVDAKRKIGTPGKDQGMHKPPLIVWKGE